MRVSKFIPYFILALLTSCQAITYEGSTAYSSDIWKPVEIKLVLGQQEGLGTKATGAIDTEEFWKWKDAHVFVYAFMKDSTDFRARCTDTDKVCILDGASDEGPNAGKAALVSGTDEFMSWKYEGEGAPTYPEGTEPYEFYAYYLDDCTVDDGLISRTKESISMPVTITGAQDLMTAKAVITETQLDGLGFTEKEKEVLKGASYSAYSANLGIHPELYFKHHLVRLDFEVYPYRKQASEVWIQEIKVESRNKGTFTVAHKDTTMVGVSFPEGQELVPLALMDKDHKTVLKRDTYNVPWVDEDASKPIYERSSLKVGGNLLVSPEEKYICSILMKDLYDDNIPYRFEINSGEGGFKPGYRYTVRLGIYGRNMIVPDVIVREWKDGGDYELDVNEQ